MKHVAVLLILMIAPILARGEEPVFHFRFDRTLEQKSVKDIPGKTECISDHGIFLVEQGGLRVAAGTRFHVPASQLPPMTEKFTLNAWYIGSTRGLSNTLFSKGMWPDAMQFKCFVQNLSPGLFGIVGGQGKGIYLSGYGHMTVYPDKSVIADKSNADAIPGKWTMLTYIFNRGDIEVYVNGRIALRQKAAQPYTLTPDNGPLNIGTERQKGTSLNKSNSDMLINDLSLYKNPLSADEVARLYAEESGKYPKEALWDSWSKLPPCNVYMKRLIPGYDPQYEERLPKTAEYLKTLTAPKPIEGRTVSKLVFDKGALRLSINGKLYAPLMYQTAVNLTQEKDFGRQFEDFAAAGFVLYGGSPGSWHDFPQIWKGDKNYDFTLIDQLLRRMIELNPKARIQLAVHPEPIAWFQREHKKELELYYVAGRSKDELKIFFTGPMGSDAWLESVSDMLENLVRHVEKQDYANYVFDYKIFMSGGGEWYWPGCFTGGVSGYSEGTRNTFRRWLKEKYGTDAEIRKAWSNPGVTLATAEVPSPEFRMASEYFNFRDPVKARPCYDFRDYMNERTILNIRTITGALKRGCDGRKTVTTYYGYPLHYASTADQTQFTSGVNTLGQVFRLDTVDNIATPITYRRRQVGEAGVNINPFNGSARLHNKLIWHENDLRTHIFPEPLYGRPETWQESCMQIRRGFSLASTMGMGCWFLGLPAYAYHEEHIMNEMAELQKQADAQLRNDCSSVAEVALIYDEDSMRHTGFNPNSFLAAHVWDLYDNLFHAGAPFDSYLLSDIDNPRMPDYKLYLFVNTFEATPEKIAKIAAKVRRKNSVVLWSYAPGFISPKGFGTDFMRELTGFSFGFQMEQPKVKLAATNSKHPITQYGVNPLEFPVGPFVYVEDPSAEILGTAAGKPALAVKSFQDWKSVYTLMPFNRQMIEGLYDFAGVHRYAKGGDVISLNKSYMMLHASSAGDKTFYLKKPSDIIEVFSGKVLGKNVSTFCDRNVAFGTTRLYLIK